MTENRIFIFTDSDAKQIGKKSHDSSIVASLPRIGDTIFDKVKLDFQEEEKLIHAIVRVVEFHYYEVNSIAIYAEVIKSV